MDQVWEVGTWEALINLNRIEKNRKEKTITKTTCGKLAENQESLKNIGKYRSFKWNKQSIKVELVIRFG